MAKALKTVGIVLGAVALIATGIGAVAGAAGFLGLAAGTWTTIGVIAGIGATAANIGAQVLTKPPPTRGSVAQAVWDPNAPTPYVMGEGYAGPVIRYDVGYGATLKKVVNPYRFQVHDYCGGGPIESITPYVDFGAVGSYYSGFLYTDTQLGACPETDALAAHWSGVPDWGSSYKLSGKAAIGWSFLFDKSGKKFANGLPTLGAYGQWAKVYDPRLDSTFPGGSGSHRLGDETTYEWSENPALHFGTYAYGRYQNDKLVMGVGLPSEGIDWTTIAAWANTCDLNSWAIYGRVFEPGDRWQNLKDIALAGGAVPAFAGAVLSIHFWAPVVALDTITEADVADEALTVTYMQSYRDRLNTIIPKYTSADHNWEQVSAAPVQVSTYLTDDGEERREEWPFNLVKSADQAAQLARYVVEDSRELHPIRVVCHPRMRGYRPGDCLHLDLPQLGLDHDAIVQTRSIDPATGKVTFTLISETPGKHAFALGQTGTPPATPALVQTGEDADTVAQSTGDRQVAIEVPRVRFYSANYVGTVQTPPLPDAIVPTVTLGGADIRADDSVDYAISSSGVTASVNDSAGDPDKGTITVSAVDGLNGWIDLTVTVDGRDYPAQRIVVQKQLGLPPSFGGPGSKIAADNGFNTINTNTFTAITDTLTVTLASGESLYGTAPLDYSVIGSAASRTATAKWQYSPAGAGTWSDFDIGAIAGSAANGGTAVDGHGDFTDSATGLSAGDYDVRLVAELNLAAVDVTFTGTATVEAKV
jgi:hypothetical protein